MLFSLIQHILVFTGVIQPVALNKDVIIKCLYFLKILIFVVKSNTNPAKV